MAPVTSSRRSAWRDPWVFGLGLLALLMRLIELDRQLWFDEVQLLVELVRQPLGHVLTSYANDNNHPLYSILAWLSVAAFGESAWALRLPAVLFGAASVPMLYRLALRYRPRSEAVLAALVLAVSYHHVWFSQNARGYTGLLFFTLLATRFFLRVLDTGRRRAVLGHGLALAGATFVHLTGIYVALAQFLVWSVLAVRGRRADPTAAGSGPAPWRSLQGFLIGGLVSLGLHAGMLGQIAHFFLFRENARAPDADWTSPLWTLVEAGRTFGLASPPGIAIALGTLVVAGAGLRWWWRRDPAATACFVLPGLLGLVVTLALGRNLWPRFFFFVSGFAVLIVLRGVGDLAGRLARRAPPGRLAATLPPLAMAAVVLASSALLPRAYELPKQDFVGARDWVLEKRAPGDPIMTVGLACYPYLRYYAPEFRMVDDPATLEEALAAGLRPWVLTTFPVFLRTRFPEIFELLEREFEEVARFRGTAGDGDVIVLAPRGG